MSGTRARPTWLTVKARKRCVGRAKASALPDVSPVRSRACWARPVPDLPGFRISDRDDGVRKTEGWIRRLSGKPGKGTQCVPYLAFPGSSRCMSGTVLCPTNPPYRATWLPGLRVIVAVDGSFVGRAKASALPDVSPVRCGAYRGTSCARPTGLATPSSTALRASDVRQNPGQFH
jgi:hypothetical protein